MLSITRRIHHAAIACALACALLASAVSTVIMSTLAHTRIRLLTAIAAAMLLFAGSAQASGPSNPNANCTAGFAYGAGGQALASVAQPPKQYGSLSDVGYYSRTDCG